MPDEERPAAFAEGRIRTRLARAPSRPSGVVVFAGPCLPRPPDPRWRVLLSRVDLRPPARRGDVLTALAGRPRTILLLDGYYYTVPSVTHKELLYALEAGVRVIGAASIGALRATELETFGMMGVGRVFDLFRTGVLDGDDEVAILHAPAHLGYEPLTAALVELRVAIAGLIADGWIDERAGARFVDAVKRESFSRRHPAFVSAAAHATLGARAAERLDRRLRDERIKEADAREALELAVAPARRVSAVVPGRSETAFLHRFKEQSFCAPAGRRPAPGASVLRCWFLVQLFHPAAPRFVRSLRLRYLAFSEGTYAGLRVAPAHHARIVRALRGSHEREFGATWLPGVEYEDEARIQALADTAADALGGLPAICRRLAHRLGLSVPDAEEALLRLLEGLPDAVPPWWQARAFTFSGAVRAARNLYGAANAVHACAQRSFRGATLSWRCLVDVAASIWNCAPSGVIAEAARRGLYVAPGASEGLRDALELVAAAERLPVSVNDYPRAKLRLQQTVISPFEAPTRRAYEQVSERHPPAKPAATCAVAAPTERTARWCRTLFSVDRTGIRDDLALQVLGRHPDALHG